jgi:hypothetical protein
MAQELPLLEADHLSIMGLCSFCQAIVLALTTEPSTDTTSSFVQRRTVKLSDSANFCSFCRMIKNYILNLEERKRLWKLWQSSGDVRVFVDSNDNLEKIAIRLKFVAYPDDYFRISLSAEKSKRRWRM